MIELVLIFIAVMVVLLACGMIRESWDRRRLS
jgi:hypothetical protein